MYDCSLGGILKSTLRRERVGLHLNVYQYICRFHFFTVGHMALKNTHPDVAPFRLRISELEEENVRLRAAHFEQMRILRSLEIINRIIIESTNLDQMLDQALQQFLKFFSCDRAWLLYPCDPNTATYRVPMERTRPEWPGAEVGGIDVPLDGFSRWAIELATVAPGVVRFDPQENTIQPDGEVSTQFHIRSQMMMAIRPKTGKPWALGIHNCAEAVTYSQNDCDLFEVLGSRLADGLSSMISWQDSKSLFENAEVSIWNEDLSAVRNTLDELRQSGVTDLRQYLQDHEQAAWDMLAMVKVIHVNAATLTLFGADSEDDFFTSINKTFGVGTIDVVIEELCAIWDKQDTFRSEVAFRTLDGKDIHAIISFRIPQTEDGFRSVPVSIIDITERKSMEMALVDAKLEAEKANKAKSEFLASMSHDLRTPLNAIMGFSEMMLLSVFGPLGSSQYEDYVNDIHRSGELLVSLINDVLDLSKIESGKYLLQEHSLDIAAVIDNSIKQLTGMARASDVSLFAEVPADIPPLRGDERALTQILNNTLSNAIKFTEGGGDVNISAALHENGGIQIAVSDTGIGMTAGGIAMALKTFEDSKGLRTRDQGGTGLGLHLCVNLMTLFGGDLQIESEINKGTVVTLYFPPERTIVSTKALR